VTRTRLGGILLAAGLASGFAADTRAEDFHQTFEARCAGCHGHAGDFARAHLTEGADGALEGVTTGRNVADFLRRHAGGLSGAESAQFITVFRRQLGSGAFYRERCDICHDRAYELTRLRLVLRDGKLIGRYSGRDMAEFLPGHARMTPDEAQRMLEALTALRQGAR
jgi:hypothetical protein